MHIVIAGASGFLGSNLSAELSRQGHQVTKLVRRETRGQGESRWDPDHGHLDAGLVQSAQVVINLAGSPTVGNPHSKAWAHELERTRVTTTRLLAEAVAGAATRPALLAGNGISYYGDHGADVVTEATPSLGAALLTRVTRAWQEAADPAVAAGARVCVLRTAPVLDQHSAPLKQLAMLFRLGLGGKLGSGRQFFPVISLRDWVSAVVWLAQADDVHGAFNLCCPQVPTNAEFTSALARKVRRPAVLPVPSALLRVASGPMAPELLGSVRAVPEALLRSGYDFADENINEILTTALR